MCASAIRRQFVIVINLGSFDLSLSAGSNYKAEGGRNFHLGPLPGRDFYNRHEIGTDIKVSLLKVGSLKRHRRQEIQCKGKFQKVLGYFVSLKEKIFMHVKVIFVFNNEMG